MTRHAAIDLGASSGRVVVADVTSESLSLREVHRFPNGPVQQPDGLHWDVDRLHQEVLSGLRQMGRVESIGIDSWAVDYGLLASSGELLNQPWCYRDSRTDGVQLSLSREVLFARNGLQHLPFTTAYQLAVEDRLEAASSVLLIPDLLTYWLTGEIGSEVTNASTTGLLDATTRTWSPEVLAAVGVSEAQLGPLVQPGTPRGSFHGVDVIAVGSHDTASAFVGAPLTSNRSVCISLGTWGLVGLELADPILTEGVRAANVTNELGVDGRVRFLRNVPGLWLLQECLREWGGGADLLELLLEEAADIPAQVPFDLDDDALLAPGDMPARLTAHIAACGLRPARRRAHLVRYILDSLAEALASTVEVVTALASVEPDVVHVVGGGARNALLCRLLAQRTGLVVLAGPVEATAVGNALVQARAVGTLSGGLEDLRQLVRRTTEVVRYEPS
ncbi:MAG: carbohydrate kinase [Frankiales bacterium]|nr:carbohydrate kinase [Frankiales bacterium]